MKFKSYWESTENIGDPFQLPRRVIHRIIAAVRRFERSKSRGSTIKYVWIHLTSSGVASPDRLSGLALDDWLNIIDESAACGAEWLMIRVDTELDRYPQVWNLCRWAQDAHQLQVGIHLANPALAAEDLGCLCSLRPGATHVVADRELIPQLRYLEENGIQICEANLRPEERTRRCSYPAKMTCVAADGSLYSCGLVLRDSRYALGNAFERSLQEVIEDESLPHEIEDTSAFPLRGCDGCPSHIFHH